MTIKSKKFTKGIVVKPTTSAASEKGEIRYDSADDKVKVYADDATSGENEKELVTNNQTQTLENKTIDSASNTITVNADEAAVSELQVSNLKAGVLETDLNNVVDDTNLPSAQSVKNYVAQEVATKDEASEISYNNVASGLTATDVQAAVDEVEGRLDTAEADVVTAQATADNHIADAVGAHAASAISFDNVASGLTATEVQAAIDEVEGRLDTAESNITAADGALTTHIADTSTHGVTGDIVGTTDVQDLSNKAIIDPSRLDVKKAPLATLETYALTATDGQIVFDTDNQEMYQIVNNSLSPIGGGGATSFEITQASHGFVVGDGIYHNGTSWVKGQANVEATLAYYTVVEVPDANTFTAADFGRIEVPLHGFTVGEYYFLSDSVAGQPTTTEPANAFSNPLFYVEDANTLQIKVYRPTSVGADINLDNLSDVSAGVPSDGDIITYSSGSGLWEKESRDLTQTVSITNNQAVAADVTGIVLDTASHRGFKLTYNIYREGSSDELSQTGTLHVAYRPTAATFSLSEHFSGDDAGVTFSINAGQLQYTSTDVTGQTTGELRIRIVEKL